MKELSIEQKVKAYDKALERMKSWARGEHPECFTEAQKAAEFVFPELKESEDEKIRNFISNELACLRATDGKGSDRYEELTNAITWLKKQGEQKSIDNLTQQEAMDIAVAKCFDEQKPADKVEPKFKIEKGKWYVCIKDLFDNYANKAFRKGDIYLSTQDGSLIPSNSNVPYEVICFDTYFRDWTIQDAKDGDVLSYRDGQWIFIYKEKIDNNSFSYYTLYSTIYRDLTINDDCFTVLRSAIIPATKEQCDILIKAMADAGYIFDFEKKELKKIEQKPAWSEEDEKMFSQISDILWEGYKNRTGETPTWDNIREWCLSVKDRVQPQPKQEWKQENTCDLTDFENTMMHIGESFFGKNAGLDPNDTNIIKEQANLLLELVPNKEWSEENEHWRQKAIDFMKHPDLIKAMPTLAKNTIDWLKSLKSQPKQKWSEEDKRTLQGIIGEIEANKHHAPDCDLATYDWFLSWLKSLKDRCTWNPSCEQIIALRWVLNNIPYNKHKEEISGLLDQIKEL